MTAGKLRVPAWPILAKICECRELQLHYPHAVSDLRVCGYGDMQLQVRVSSYSHVALQMSNEVESHRATVTNLESFGVDGVGYDETETEPPSSTTPQ